MRIAFALAGLHRIDRGAEVAFMSIGEQLAKRGHTVTLFGSGQPRDGKAYAFQHVGSIAREKFEKLPNGPLFRDDTAYEELTFAASLSRHLKPSHFDIVCGCSYPFTNWVLRRPTAGGQKPKTVFITQNGDHPATAGNREYRFFGCDGIVCINPDFYENNKTRWNAVLIPNGVDTARFRSAVGDRLRFGLPAGKKIVLMVSAFIASKRVDKAIEVVSRLPDIHLAVAGNGPERDHILSLAQKLLPGRFTNMTLSAQDMPALYHSADAFLHMSKAEAFGNVYIEALASGLPVVAHDIPRHRWVVGETGFYANTDDVDATAKALSDALGASGNKRDERIAATAKYDWSLIAEKYERFFETLIAPRGLAA
jgi:glycosyltransferase involved in cell wall biosynthesis